MIATTRKTITFIMMIIISSSMLVTSFMISSSNSDQYDSTILRSAKLMKLQNNIVMKMPLSLSLSLSSSRYTSANSHQCRKRQHVFICHSNHKDDDEMDNDIYNNNNNNNNDHDHELNVNTNHGEISSSSTSSSHIFEDEECYDLCDNYDDFILHQQDEDDALDNHDNNDTADTADDVVDDDVLTTDVTIEDYVIPQTNTKQEIQNDPQPTKQVWQNLELKWSIDESTNDCDIEDISSCSEPCPHCRGTGLILCQFCGGVGYIDFGFAEKGTIGEKLLDNPNGRLGTECPVCNDDGEQICPHCKGSGWIAKWRLDSNLSDLHP